MTKNKRFTMIDYTGCGGNIIYDENKTDGECLEDNEILDLLNKLAEENEELIEELQEFKSYSKALSEELSLANRDNTALDEENEELKTQNNAYLQDIEVFKEENTSLKLYKNAVHDILLSYSQKNLTAKQLQVVIGIMEELNIGCVTLD